MQRTCSAGHVYDADQFASCPYCNRNTRAIQFGAEDYSATVAPGKFDSGAGSDGAVAGGNANNYGATVAPNAGFGPAAAPNPTYRNAAPNIGETVMPETVRHRVERDVESKTVGVFKRNLGFEPVVGWLVCIEGPEVGKDYRLYGRINTIGRSESNDVVLPQEHSVSQKNHVRLAYDAKHNDYQLIPGDGSNLTYLNDEPLYVPQRLNAHDVIELGTTKLVFVPLCTEKFCWPNANGGGKE